VASKSTIIKFGPQNKAKLRMKVQHSRTGACTAKGKCYHGMIQSHNRKKSKGGGL